MNPDFVVSRGQMVSLPSGYQVIPPQPSFAYEATVDGQKVRCEAPTLNGLLKLLAAAGVNLPNLGDIDGG
jgi:hypothetical protein